jgi:tryptophan synthase alpha chain
LLVGFGIKSHDDAMRMSQHTDGFIVGSALIETVEQLWDEPTRDASARLNGVERFVRTLTQGPASPDSNDAESRPSVSLSSS